jgi:hypothetical protein
MTPGELERSVENLRGMIAVCQARSERVKARLAVAEAALSQHQHDWTRDILSKPTTFAPATHTHAAYASSTHIHNYQDWYVNDGGDVSRTTGPAA